MSFSMGVRALGWVGDVVAEAFAEEEEEEGERRKTSILPSTS